MVKEKINSKEYLKKLDKELELISITFDPIFKGVFGNNLNLLKRFLNSVLELNLDLEECNITLLNSELPKENYKEYKKIVDIRVILNERIYIDLEINRSNFEKVKLRNYLYDHKLFSMILESGENTEKLKNTFFYQLNLNTKDKTIPYGEDIIVSYGLKTKSIYVDNKYIVLKYLEFYRNLYYTNHEELTEGEIWLASLTAKTFTELNEMLSHILSNSEKEQFIGDVIRMSNDYFNIHEWEREKCEQLVKSEERRIQQEELEKARKQAMQEGRTAGLEQGREEGREQGIEQGREEILIQTIKSMLKKDISLQDISDITGKTIKEIKIIAKNNN